VLYIVYMVKFITNWVVLTKTAQIRPVLTKRAQVSSILTKTTPIGGILTKTIAIGGVFKMARIEVVLLKRL
jgi:hypothetical protein